jgi:hypothetical protein
MARASKLVRAKSTFAAEVEGVQRIVHRGDVLPASDPVVKAHKAKFEDELAVEQATAAPGEKRKR